MDRVAVLKWHEHMSFALISLGCLSRRGCTIQYEFTVFQKLYSKQKNWTSALDIFLKKEKTQSIAWKTAEFSVQERGFSSSYNNQFSDLVGSNIIPFSPYLRLFQTISLSLSLWLLLISYHRFQQ